MNREIIYLDNAATTKVDDEVVKEIEKYCFTEYGNPSSLHSLGLFVQKSIESIVSDFKKIFGEDKKIIFTSCGTESNNQVIFGLKHLGKHIITTKIEHPSVLEPIKELESKGYSVTYLDVDKNGFVDENELDKAITKDTFLVTIMHVNNEIGTIQDIEKLCKIVKLKNSKIIFHTDAVQSFMKIDSKIFQNMDLITISAHKIHGPKGIGALIIKKNIELKPIFFGGHQQQNLRSGTQNVIGIVGFGTAIKQNFENDNILKLKKYLMSELIKINGISINGFVDDKTSACNILNVLMKNVEGEVMLHHLEQDNIFVSVGSACSASNKKPSHVLTALGLSDKDARCSMRISLSKYNTKKEVDFFLEKFKKYYKDLL
ncbi:MAG: cysteine desulfurase family protein [Candidatus Woesearchaeota archaeon]|jgi:cysteine desulfurase